jgi:hypothetical protein
MIFLCLFHVFAITLKP